jgi:hypothetical protein
MPIQAAPQKLNVPPALVLGVAATAVALCTLIALQIYEAVTWPRQLATTRAWVSHTFEVIDAARLPNVKTEMSLHVLAYNLKRAMQIFGVVPLMRAIRA